MSRGLSASMLAEIAKSGVDMFHAIELGFDTPLRTTTYHRDLVIDGNTYYADSNLLSFGSVKESVKIEVGSNTVTLSGVDQTNIATSLLEDFMGDSMTIYMGFVLNGNVIDSPDVKFEGSITSFDIKENYKAGTCTLKWTASSHWADFEKVSGRRTNDTDQQFYFSGDKGFEFAPKIIRRVLWGIE